jgi:flagellar basal body-associated protein FliL
MRRRSLILRISLLVIIVRFLITVEGSVALLSLKLKGSSPGEKILRGVRARTLQHHDLLETTGLIG